MLNVLFLLRIFLRRIYIIKFNETAADTLKKKKKNKRRMCYEMSDINILSFRKM